MRFALALLSLLIVSVTHAGVPVQYDSVGLAREGLRQTLASVLMTGPHGEDFYVELPSRKDSISLLDVGFERRFDLKLKWNASSDHVVLIVPGFGEHFDATVGPYISELLFRNGFSTLVTHSPASEPFILNSSTPGRPGVQRWDALDLYDMIAAAKQKLEAEQKVKIRKVSVIGTSLGSINAAHLLLLDKSFNTQNRIGFHKVFSINPPVSNVYGVSVLDALIRLSLYGDASFNTFVATTAAIKGVQQVALAKEPAKNFEDAGKMAPTFIKNISMSLEELRFFMGYAFQGITSKGILGVDKRFTQDLTGIFHQTKEAPRELFETFFLKITYPAYRIIYPTYENALGHTVDSALPADLKKIYGPALALLESESIGYLASQLKDPRYHVITWEDDLLLRNEDPQWLRNTFSGGSNGHAVVFKTGGHTGGYYQKDFQTYLLKSLK